MWVTIVEAIENSWRSVDRQEVITAIDSLPHEMSSCFERYEWLCEARIKLRESDEAAGYKRASALCEMCRVKWRMHVLHIISALKKLGRVLSIWSKDTQKTLAMSLNGQTMPFYASRMLRMLGRDLGEEPGIDIEPGEMEASFSEGLERLEAFVRASF